MNPNRKRQTRRQENVEYCVVDGIQMGVPTPVAGPGDDYPKNLTGYHWPDTPFGRDLRQSAEQLGDRLQSVKLYPGMQHGVFVSQTYLLPLSGVRDEYTVVGLSMACVYLMPLLRGDTLGDIPESMVEYMDTTSKQVAGLLTTPRDQLEVFVRSLEGMLDRIRRPAMRNPHYMYLMRWLDSLRYTAAIIDELRQGAAPTMGNVRPVVETLAAFAGYPFTLESAIIYRQLSHGKVAGEAVSDAVRQRAVEQLELERQRYVNYNGRVLRALAVETENFRRLLTAHFFGSDETTSGRPSPTRAVHGSTSLSEAHQKIKQARAEDPMMYRPTYVDYDGTWRSVLYDGSPYVIAYEVTRPNPKTGFPYRNKAMRRIVFYRNLTFSSAHTKARATAGVFEQAIQELDKLYDEDGNLVEKRRDRLRNLIAKHEPLYLQAMDIQQERRERGAARDSEDYRAGRVPGVKVPANYPPIPPPAVTDQSADSTIATTSGPAVESDDNYYRSDLYNAFQKIKWPVRIGKRTGIKQDGRLMLHAGYLQFVFNGPTKPLDVYIGSERYTTVPRETPDKVVKRALQMVADLRAIIDQDDSQSFDAALVDAIRSTVYDKDVHFGPPIRPVIAKMRVRGETISPAEFAYLMAHRHRLKKNWEIGPWRFVGQTPNMNTAFSGEAVELASKAPAHAGDLLHRVNLIPKDRV